MAGITVAILGAVIGALLFPVNAPLSLRTPTPEQTYTSEIVTFDDPQTVQVSLKIGADVPLSSLLGGRLTRSDCIEGAAISSGSSPLSIDGQALLALDTSMPLWRNLVFGDTGPDVIALRQSLIALGIEIPSEGSVDSKLIASVSALLSGFESSRTRLTEIPFERIVWIPEQNVLLNKCLLHVGEIIEPGSNFASIQGQLLAVHIVDYPITPLLGLRFLEVMGVQVELDENSSSVNDAALEAIRNSPEYKSAISATDKFEAVRPGIIRLITPQKLTAVSPVTLFGIEEKTACVKSNASIYKVTIVGSKFGQTFINPVSDKEAIPRVLTVPTGQESCK
ncbi:hypothetical protein M2118_000044 [Aurantimicrobium minutum]|uniref:hypothetical protein n=1 Tax=Aurantimicrobium minutum TaxID=708131 RepID=UPI002474C42A|nr:hypothetical protein [Aurantimicrobium minutum]MDH6277093.1 hypothetical protein [Aurantimicrobium minutum]